MESWQEFEARCERSIDNIKRTNDQGHFARIYAVDVGVLLKMIRELQDKPGPLQRAFDEAKK